MVYVSNWKYSISGAIVMFSQKSSMNIIYSYEQLREAVMENASSAIPAAVMREALSMIEGSYSARAA